VDLCDLEPQPKGKTADLKVYQFALATTRITLVAGIREEVVQVDDERPMIVSEQGTGELNTSHSQLRYPVPYMEYAPQR